MKLSNIIGASLVASVLLITIPGCDNKGPAEKAGASIDNAVEKTGEQIEKAGDAIKDTANGNNR
jgi:predicted small lipoprotein YifL